MATPDFDSYRSHHQSLIKSQQDIHQLDSCPHCGYSLAPYDVYAAKYLNFERFLQCTHCHTYWGILQSTFTDISSLVGLKHDA